MHIFDTIYKKDNMLQCKFSDNFIHPTYIGTEFPLGQHLITAISYNREYVKELYSDLIKTYISYLNDGTESNFKEYELALFKIDDYCIYLHEISHRLITTIKATHPKYSLSDCMDFIKSYKPDTITPFTMQFSKIKKDSLVQFKECILLWNIAVDIMLNEFDLSIATIKSDISDICNAPATATGLDRIAWLDVKRKTHFFDMDFPIRLSVDLGEAVDSKFFISQKSDEESIAYSVSLFTTEQLMYYDFSSSLENNLPFKMCKNCNTPFIPKGRVDSLYCDRIMPGFKDKCSAIGAINTYKTNQSDIEAKFYAARKRYATRVSRNPTLKTEFEVWKIKSREKLIAYREGKLSADEFRKWFMDDEWMKVN